MQKLLPDAKVVKTMNTCAGRVIVSPSPLERSSIFISGNDAAAKSQAMDPLRGPGWTEDSIVNLGGISSAKGPEHHFIMWACLTEALDTTSLNIRVVRSVTKNPQFLCILGSRAC